MLARDRLEKSGYGRRLAGVLKGIDASNFIQLPVETLRALQYSLGMGDKWGVWNVPCDFVAEGHAQRKSARVLTIESVCRSSAKVNREVLDQVWAEVLRYAVARSLFCGRAGIVGPGTVANEVRSLLHLARVVLSNSSLEEGFWPAVSRVSLESLQERHFKGLLSTVEFFHVRGLLPGGTRLRPITIGVAGERNRTGEAAPTASVVTSSQWRPFPDRFTAEAGWRALWFIRTIGPTLLDAIEHAICLEVPRRKNGRDYRPGRRQQGRIAAARNQVIQKWNWRTPSGEQIDDLSFQIGLKKWSSPSFSLGTPRPDFKWPPRAFSDAWLFLNLIQAANMFCICLSGGQRSSEVAALRENCLVAAPGVGERVTGRTYKLTRRIGGRERDFVAPEVVADAIHLQVRIARAAKHLSGQRGEHLWVRLRTTRRAKLGQKMICLGDFLQEFARKLSLLTYLSPDCPTVHIHRFRKTLARIVALALVNSPMILMDCFGHTDPEMTIRRYILADPGIAREALLVQQELVILMAADVVSNSIHLGGEAGLSLERRRTDFLRRIGKTEYEPQDAYEFARRETYNGRSWMMVAPGIYCTLPDHEMGGPCSKHQGRGSNPAYCQSGCKHQLLSDPSRPVVEDAIGDIVRNIERAESDDEPMLIAQWVGQLRNWLFRWRDIHEKWSGHPVVQRHARTL